MRMGYLCPLMLGRGKGVNEEEIRNGGRDSGEKSTSTAEVLGDA